MAASRITVVDYDPEWPGIAARLIEEIRAACGDALVGVEHIGSTSVPGLAAKPVIDLMPVLVSFEAGRRCIAPMETLGHEYRGAYGIAGRHYFVRDDAASGLRTHVHMLVHGSEEWRRHLLFRDFLRAQPDEAAAYGAMKRDLARRTWRDGNAYAEAKTPFIEAALERAVRWAASRSRA